ncbi:MAG: transporter ATP-binding protein [Frankiales bacterium]|nr:transporter ATP-binding protein [Frankiales bacterium]
MGGKATAVRLPYRGRVTTALAPPRAAAVALKGLTTHRGDACVTDAVSFEIGSGEVFGLLGPNGAGKTTLVRQLVGVLRPDEGTVTLLGREVTGDSRAASEHLAYLAQTEPALHELPVGLAVESVGRCRGLSKRAAGAATTALLDELGLTDLRGRPLCRLSGGERRLAELAAALVGDRPLLVLDEPTAGLDVSARRRVWDALRTRRDRGATVVLVTHNVLEAEQVLDRVAVVDRGRVIACDTPGRLKALVSDDVRLELVWRAEAPEHPLRSRALVDGRRWSLRLPAAEARDALAELTSGATLALLDDFTLATPTLEDVYVALGGRDNDLERG